MLFRMIIVWMLLLPFGMWGQRSLSAVNSKEQFLKLSGKPLSSKYGNISSVKVLIDQKSKKLYFISSKHYRYHYDFVTLGLFYTHDLYHFNEKNYSASTEREYLLANLNLNEASGIYYLDISVFDQMPASLITQLYESIRKHSYMGDKLVFLLNTNRLLEIRSQLNETIKTATPADIYAAIDYQPVNEGTVKGRLRFIPNLDSAETTILPGDIVFTRNTPEYLPAMRALMLTEFQTPLSHLVILGQNRHIPIGAYTRLYDDSLLLQLNNQWVELSILTDTFYVKKTNPGDSRPATKIIHLKKNTTVDSLIDAPYLNPALANTVGNKAANFGILQHISKGGKFSVPEAAFAIPFYWYEQHVKTTGADSLIRRLVQHPPQDQDSLQALLKDIRKRIEKGKVNADLLKAIDQRLDASGFRTFRFRSSTNAEDAEGFSGAGLYLSKTADLDDCKRTTDKALKDVWASLWSYEAYLERSFFGIDNNDVAMGILVHRSFPDEASNGVAITRNIYRESYPGFVINVQVGDVSVVTPPRGVICDQLVLYPANELSGFRRTTEVITTSSLGEGKLILTEAQIELLQNELERIKKFYWKTYYKPRVGEDYDNFGLDLEFKFSKETDALYIKQVRLYNN